MLGTGLLVPNLSPGMPAELALVGSLDLLIAFPHAAATGTIAHMAAQWYVPVWSSPVL